MSHKLSKIKNQQQEHKPRQEKNKLGQEAEQIELHPVEEPTSRQEDKYRAMPPGSGVKRQAIGHVVENNGVFDHC